MILSPSQEIAKNKISDFLEVMMCQKICLF